MEVSDDVTPDGQSVLVGIPAYNEAGTIGRVVREAQAHADEVLIVDDGSDDGTRERARDAGATLITHEKNKGYGATLATIFQYADDQGVTHLVIIDADGQHDSGDIPNLIDMQRETGAQIVTGSRFQGRSSGDIPGYRRFGLTVINLLMNVGLRVGYSYQSISDTQCGFRSYNREAIKQLASTSEIGSGMGASLDILFEAARQGYAVVEVPTEIDYDVNDASTQNPILHGLNLLKSLFVSVSRDRPNRMISAVTALALSVAIPIFTFGMAGTTPLYALVPVGVVAGLLLMVSLSGRPPTGSDRSGR